MLPQDLDALMNAGEGSGKDFDKCLVELYKPKKFVAESLTSIYSSRTSVDLNGFIRIDSARGIGDRHLKASPKLPSIQERSSQSQNKNLYDLSLQLTDQEEAVISDYECADGSGRIQCEKSKPVKAIPIGQGNEATFDLMKQLKVRDRTKLRRRLPESYQYLCAEPVILPSKTPDAPATTNRPPIKVRKAKVKPRLVESESDVESFRYSDNPKKTLKILFERAARNTGTHNRDVEVETFENKNLGRVLEDRASLQVQLALHVIGKNINNDHYCYSLLIFVATLAYLVYILCYDITSNLNEEGRYQEKMKNSRLPMKAYYYLMRLLRAPIF
ncbi:GM15843 [Drosophila sechellia]|uniref:GM15843 n=1 Tax=Drosophila sechellia TaxID=7238 RepID=B4I7S1_DROSE|nr:GM15843 [Drosophila sechellia]